MSGQADEALVTEFCQITGSNPDTAATHLAESGGDINGALASFYADMDSGDHEQSSSRPLGGAASSTPASSAAPTSSRSNAQSSQKKKFSSLRDLMGGSSAQGDDDDSDKEQEYFAGGDKSALAVQDPNSNSNSAADHIRRLMDTARRNGPPPPEEEDRPNHFTGQGQTLGGDDVESRIIADPNASASRSAPMVERTLHLWADGFSVDDGQLYRYDDPANRQILNMINSGSAPLDIMNVENGQAVDVKLAAHRGENYVQPKKKYVPFSGSGGQRLGSPTPGAGSSQAAPSQASSSPTASAPAAQKPEVDESQPVMSLQIRLADGTRLPSRFNTTQTIGDVYAFVDRASSSGSRAYSLATTFPTKELSDRSQTLGDMAEFKRGGVIVQKWA